MRWGKAETTDTSDHGVLSSFSPAGRLPTDWAVRVAAIVKITIGLNQSATVKWGGEEDEREERRNLLRRGGTSEDDAIGLARGNWTVDLE